MLKIGTKAPVLDIVTHDGYSGPVDHYWQNGPLILFFYPKDDTMVCTKEACTFQSSLSEFGTFNATVLGCSTDSAASHEKFAEKNQLNFPLVADTKGAFSKAYEAYRSILGICKRISYLIGPQGIVLGAVHNELSVNAHMEMVRKSIKSGL